MILRNSETARKQLNENTIQAKVERAATPYEKQAHGGRGVEHISMTGNGFSSQISPQDLSHMNSSKMNQHDYYFERRSSIEQADIDKMIKRNQGTG
jgi:hypothetical protein